MRNQQTRIIAVLALIAAVFAVVLAFSSCSHVHEYDNITVIKEATCNEQGESEAFCECGQMKKIVTPTIEHTLGEWEITREPTCSSGGSKSISCTVCGMVVDIVNVSARTHDIVSVPAKAATCAELGNNAYEYCSYCEYTTYSELPKTSHTPGADATCTKPQLCKVCGDVIIEALGHSGKVTAGKPATCTSTGIGDKIECERCGILIQDSIEIPMRQHVIAVVKGIARTCSSSGTTDSLVCLVCEEEIASPITLPSGSGEHYFDGNFCEYCDFSLKIYNKCEHGDDEKDEDGDMVFVSWIKEKKGKDATCSKYGYNDWSYCEECFAIIDAPTQIAPTAHDLKVVEGFAATALTSGLSDGYVCENTPCKLIVKHQEILPAVTEEMLSDGSEKLGGKLDYVKNDDGTTCTITGIGSCTVDELVIPEFINGLRVTAIGKEAFKNETSLESVTIPKYVSEIGKKAFSGCSSLETVVLPDCADVAGDAFASTSNVEFEFTHSLVYIAEVEATRCDRIGTVEHYVCVYCNERYADAAAKEQLFNVRDTIEHNFEEGECGKCHTSYEEAVIISINTPDTITVDKGTLRKDLVLPTTVVGVRDLDDEDDVYVNLEVHWDLSEYDGETEGTYEITGYVSFNEYVARKKSGRTEGLGDTVTLKIKVK